MNLGLCGVCNRLDLSLEESRSHERRHGEKRFELGKARLAAKVLGRLPRSTPGYPFLQLLATPRIGIPRDQRMLQNLEALLKTADQPGGEAFARAILRGCPQDAEELVALAAQHRPRDAQRLQRLLS